MTAKKLMLVAVLVGVLCEMARAEPGYRVEITTPGAAKPHSILLTDGSCGEHTMKAPLREKSYRACARAHERGVRFELDLRERDGDTEQRSSIVVVARIGSVLRIDDKTISVKEP